MKNRDTREADGALAVKLIQRCVYVYSVRSMCVGDRDICRHTNTHINAPSTHVPHTHTHTHSLSHTLSHTHTHTHTLSHTHTHTHTRTLSLSLTHTQSDAEAPNPNHERWTRQQCDKDQTPYVFHEGECRQPLAGY